MSFLYCVASLGSTNNYQILFAERTIKLFIRIRFGLNSFERFLKS